MVVRSFLRCAPALLRRTPALLRCAPALLLGSGLRNSLGTVEVVAKAVSLAGVKYPEDAPGEQLVLRLDDLFHLRFDEIDDSLLYVLIGLHEVVLDSLRKQRLLLSLLLENASLLYTQVVLGWNRRGPQLIAPELSFLEGECCEVFGVGEGPQPVLTDEVEIARFDLFVVVYGHKGDKLKYGKVEIDGGVDFLQHFAERGAAAKGPHFAQLHVLGRLHQRLVFELLQAELDALLFCDFAGQDLDVLCAVVVLEPFVGVERVCEDGAEVGFLEP